MVNKVHDLDKKMTSYKFRLILDDHILNISSPSNFWAHKETFYLTTLFSIQDLLAHRNNFWWSHIFGVIGYESKSHIIDNMK